VEYDYILPNLHSESQERYDGVCDSHAFPSHVGAVFQIKLQRDLMEFTI